MFVESKCGSLSSDTLEVEYKHYAVCVIFNCASYIFVARLQLMYG